jgi:hypothetical protein
VDASIILYVLLSIVLNEQTFNLGHKRLKESHHRNNTIFLGGVSTTNPSSIIKIGPHPATRVGIERDYTRFKKCQAMK